MSFLFPRVESLRFEHAWQQSRGLQVPSKLAIDAVLALAPAAHPQKGLNFNPYAL